MSEPYADRRGSDRRKADRRQSRPMVEESWFGALGGADTEIQADDAYGAAPVLPLERGAPSAAEDAHRDAQRQQSREARRVATSSDTALRCVFRTYVAARAVLGLLLAAVPWVVSLPNVHSP